MTIFGSNGRSDTAAVIITSSLIGSLPVEILAENPLVDERSSFVLSASVTANVSMTLQWSLYLNSIQIPLSASTVLIRTFPAYEAVDGVIFPLLVNLDAPVADKSYTFRISLNPTSYPQLLSYAETDTTVLSSPQNGNIISTPSIGYALETLFNIQAPGWISENSDGYPLSYSFSYQLFPGSPETIITVKSSTSYITTTLPLGIVSYDYNITLKVVVINSVRGYSSVQTNVTVLSNQTFSVNQFVSSSITTAKASGNLNLIYQTIGSATSVYNAVFCAMAPDCGKLNHSPCTTVTNTCGSRLTNFTGISGSSNYPCLPLNITTRVIGSSCEDQTLL